MLCVSGMDILRCKDFAIEHIIGMYAGERKALNRTGLTAWMMLCMQLFQTFSRNMGINLSSRNIRMTEQHLYNTQIRPVVE